MGFIHHRSKESDYELLSQAAGPGRDDEENAEHRVRFAVPPPRIKRRGIVLAALASIMLVVFALSLARTYHLLSPRYGLMRYAGAGAASSPHDPLAQPALTHNEAFDLSMNASACAANFPILFHQFAAHEEVWKSKGGITQALVDRVEHTGYANGNSRILTKDGQLFIRAYRPDAQSRTKAIFHLIHTALATNPTAADGPLPDIDLTFSADDRDLIEKPGWVLTKPYAAEPGQWLLPDFNLASWPEAAIPSMQEFLREAAKIESDSPWRVKDNHVYFRGDPNLYEIRRDLFERVRVPGAESWADVKRTSFWEKDKAEAPIVPIWETCKHRYLIHVEGNSYSGREKYLFNCRSAVIHHKLHWRTHWHDALISNSSSPHRNAIELAGPGFKGLEELMHTLQADDVAASGTTQLSTGEQVADSAYRILAGRYLTPAATNCYIRAALRSYASVMKDGVTLKPGGGVGPGSGLEKGWQKHVHGDVAYETFVAFGQPVWPPQAPQE